MSQATTFNDALETVEQLSLEEQEALVDILRRRHALRRREQIIEDLQESRRDFAEGKCKTGSIDDLMRELTS